MSQKLIAFLAMIAREGIIPSDQQLAVLQWVDRTSMLLDGSKRLIHNLQLLARAGCGKTFTLILCVRFIHYAHLGNVRLCAFNGRIVDEMTAKLTAAGIPLHIASARTINSMGREACHKGYARNELKHTPGKLGDITYLLAGETRARNVNDESNIYLTHRAVLIDLVEKGMGQAFGARGYPAVSSMDAWDNLMQHHGIYDDLSEEDDPELIIKAAQAIYQRSLDNCFSGRKELSFNDQLVAGLVFDKNFTKFRWVFVDEEQDLSPAKLEVVLRSLEGNGGCIGVGDNFQAINGFAGAAITSMEDAARALEVKSGNPTEILKLTVTRRCPKAVVDFVRSVCPWVDDFVAHPQAIDGEVHEHIAYKDLISTVLRVTGGKPDGNTAILCRKGAPLFPLAYGFIAQGIPARIEGQELHTGLLSLVDKQKTPNKKKCRTLEELRAALDLWVENESTKKVAKLKRKGKSEEDIARILPSAMEPILGKLKCLQVLMERVLTVKGTNTVDALIDEINYIFIPPLSDKDRAAGVVRDIPVLSTGHKAKGREWRHVFVLGYYEFMPSPLALQEWEKQQERNLIYVVLTRSLFALYLVHAPPREKVEDTAVDDAAPIQASVIDESTRAALEAQRAAPLLATEATTGRAKGRKRASPRVDRGADTASPIASPNELQATSAKPPIKPATGRKAKGGGKATGADTAPPLARPIAPQDTPKAKGRKPKSADVAPAKPATKKRRKRSDAGKSRGPNVRTTGKAAAKAPAKKRAKRSDAGKKRGPNIRTKGRK